MLVETILRQAGIKPNITAVIDQVRSVTYKELYEEILNRAEMLSDFGAEDGEPVGLLFPNSVDAVTWMLAMAKTGHPVILFGSKMKENEVNYHINRIGLKLTIADRRIVTGWNGLNQTLYPFFGADNSVALKHLRELNRQGEEKFSTFEKGDFICHFTSGSEGEPKAVIRTLEAVESEIIDTFVTINLKEEQTFLTIPPICHSFGLIAGALLPLYYGHKLILEEEFLPEKILNIIDTNKVNVLFAVPYMYYLLNKRLKLTKMDFSSINMCFSAGAPMDDSVSETFRQFTGVRIIQDYGSTETGVMCLNLETDRLPKSVGRPVINRTIKLIDEEGKEINTNGESGEICILNKANVRTYLYPQELNRQKFIDGYFRTGDLGRLGQEGEVYIVGRLSSIMNVAGNKVDPVEVENVIKSISGVKETVVVCIDDINKGSIIKAYVVAEEEIDEAFVKKFCKTQMADYKIPKVVVFMKELPRSQTGKVLKKYLVKEF